MLFEKTFIDSLVVVQLEGMFDNRGSFTRFYCKKEFEAINHDFQIVQSNLSFNKSKGTLRGLHFQKEPYAEDKLVGCLRGSIMDVAVDLRKDSATFGKWFKVLLSEQNKKLLFIPKGFAHGFLTLEDNTEVFYHVSEFYNSKYESGILWNSPKLNISWEINDPIISDKDKNLKPF